MLAAQILSAMTVMICMLVDSIIIGRFLGVNAMTAYGLSNPILLVFAAVGSTLSNGIQVVCGKFMGNGDREGTNRCFSASVLLAAGISAVGVVLVLALSSDLCVFLGAGTPGPGNEVFSLTKDYLNGFIIGAPAFLCSMVMVPFMQMSGKRIRLVAAVGAMTVFDIILDLLNVFVFHGGTLGMGLASSISYYIALIIGGSYFFSKKSIFRLKFKGLTKRLFGDICKQGVPTLLNQLSIVLLVYLFNKLLLNVGTDGNLNVAAYSIISTIGNFCYCFSSGVGSVALMLTSMFFSDEDRRALHTIVKTMTLYSAVLSSAVIVLVLIAAPVIVELFLDDAGAISLAVTGVRLFALSLLPSALNTSFKNYYQGIGRVAVTNFISVFQSFAYIALFAVVLSPFIGTTGIWLSWVCGEGLMLLTIAVFVWIKNRKLSFSAQSFALLPEKLGAAEGDCLDVTVRTVQEAVHASEQASEFCLSHGETKRDSRMISLCIEEMANNIVEHGFTKDTKKDHTIDIRLIFKDGRRLIRIRDNCVNFDPVAYMDLHKTDDPTMHIGIRLVMKMVKDANYVCSLGLNNLTLVL